MHLARAHTRTRRTPSGAYSNLTFVHEDHCRNASAEVSEDASMPVIESSDTDHDEQAPQPKKPKKPKGSSQGRHERWRVRQLEREEHLKRFDALSKELGNLRALWRIPRHPRGLLASHERHKAEILALRQAYGDAVIAAKVQSSRDLAAVVAAIGLLHDPTWLRGLGHSFDLARGDRRRGVKLFLLGALLANGLCLDEAKALCSRALQATRSTAGGN